jgi:mycothiol synthase
MNDISCDAMIPGLRLRRWRDERDFAAMAQVVNSAVRAGLLAHAILTEQQASSFCLAGDFDPSADLFLAEVEDSLVGYVYLRHNQEMDGTPVHFISCLVHPEWEKGNLLRVMLHQAEQRAGEVAAEQPDSPASFILIAAFEGEKEFNALLEQEGYRAERHFFFMRRPTLEDIPVYPLPAGIEARPGLPEQSRQVWQAVVDGFSGSWGMVLNNNDEYERFVNSPNYDPSLWRVAWQGDEVVGQVLNFINPEENRTFNHLRGYTEVISVRQPWRRLGVARALLALSLQALKERGMQEAALEVDSQNADGALGLYESCGFRIEHHMISYRKPLARLRI